MDLLSGREMHRRCAYACSVHGVGPHAAQKWYDAGLRTLHDVLARGHVTPAQQVRHPPINSMPSSIPSDMRIIILHFASSPM